MFAVVEYISEIRGVIIETINQLFFVFAISKKEKKSQKCLSVAGCIRFILSKQLYAISLMQELVGK